MFGELHGPAFAEVVIHMGVDLDVSVSNRSIQCKTPKQFTIACPANLVEVKGHAVLLEAMTLVEGKLEVVLDLAGDGPLAAFLAHRIEELGLSESVVMAGAVPHGALLASYRRGDYDCVVLPSLDLGDGNHEGIPVSLMEAMALGVPVVSTKTGGIPELLTNGYDGLLVEPGDSEALAGAILALIEDPALRDRLSRAGRETVARGFNAGRNASLLVNMMKASVKTDNKE
jgi:glycosyltransferase involved in cell wall biosynthesis